MRHAREMEKLVRRLQREGFESEHLERLKARVDPDAAFDDLQREIYAEMAYSLGRSEARVDYALLRLEVAGREVETAAPGERRAAIETFNALRREALRARRDLLIHREAIGLPGNQRLKKMYPVPRSLSVD